MSESNIVTNDPYHLFAYELVQSVYQYIEKDSPFHRVIATLSTPRLFTDDHWKRVHGLLNVLVLPLIASMDFTKVLGADINITKESYKSAIGVAVDLYKKEAYSKDQFFIMCTSIAIWAFLAKRRGLPDAAEDAVDIIRDETTKVLQNGSFENSSW